MPALYEMTAQVAALQATLMEADGELTPETAAALDALGADINAKAESICKLIAQLNGEAEMFKAEADRLAAQKSVRENSVKRLKEYLKTSLETIGETKLKTPLFGLTICKNSQPSVVLAETCSPLTLPFEFTKTTIDLNRVAILKAVSEGRPIPPEITVATGTHLRIK